jgi:hypothetical protein
VNAVLWVLMVAGLGNGSAQTPLADFKTEASCRENAKAINDMRGNHTFATCLQISDKANLIWRP